MTTDRYPDADESKRGPLPAPPGTREALLRLLALVPAEIAFIDAQAARGDRVHSLPNVEVVELGQLEGPWVCVDFADGQRFAIWKETGDIYRVGHDGAIVDPPFA